MTADRKRKTPARKRKPADTKVTEAKQPRAEAPLKERKVSELYHGIDTPLVETPHEAPKMPEFDEPGVRTVHILRDGFTANGRIWYRGQEIRVKEGSSDWEKTLDTKGNSWMDMDQKTQWRRYGGDVFGEGPWPGERPGEITEEDYLASLDPEDIEALKRYEKKQQREAPLPGSGRKQRALG